MKIHLLSDLHLEFGDLVPPATDADVVVLAGDIHIKARAIAWALKHFADKPVVYVAGNHEYYGGSLGHTMQKMRSLAEGTNVHFLHDRAVIIDGVRFLGATLWTDYRLTGNQPLAELDARNILQDFKYIRDAQFRKIRPLQVLEAHVRSRAFLQEHLDAPFDGKTVVVTHHAPTELSIHERYRTTGGHLNAAYASRLDGMMGTAALWVHGHTHDSFDYDVYGTRVVCNPRGYASDSLNPDFNPGLVLEV